MLRPALPHDTSAEERIARLVHRGYEMQREIDALSEPKRRTRTPTPAETVSVATVKNLVSRAAAQLSTAGSRGRSWATSAAPTSSATGVAAVSGDAGPHHGGASAASSAAPRYADSTHGIAPSRRTKSAPRQTPNSTPHRSERALSPPTLGAGAPPAVVVPDSLAMRMYYQEREDRLYVERLFLLREEYHGRHHLLQAESSDFQLIAQAELATMAALDVQLKHAEELRAVTERLAEASRVAELRAQLHSEHQSVKTEREVVADLQREVLQRETAQQKAFERDKSRWSEERQELLRRLDHHQQQGVATGYAADTTPPPPPPALSRSTYVGGDPSPPVYHQQLQPLTDRRTPSSPPLDDRRVSQPVSQQQGGRYDSADYDTTQPQEQHQQHGRWAEHAASPLVSKVTLSTIDHTMARTTAALSRAQALLRS